MGDTPLCSTFFGNKMSDRGHRDRGRAELRKKAIIIIKRLRAGRKYGRLAYAGLLRAGLIGGVLFLAGMIGMPVLSACAGEPEKPRLIQTTTPQEELDALIELDLLQVPVRSGRRDEMTQEAVRDAQEQNRSALVRIQAGGYVGSGIIFEITAENIIIISNRHLLNKAEEAEVEFTNGVRAAGTDIRLSEQYDMGLMCVPCSLMEPEELMKLKRVNWDRECAAQAEAGNYLFVLGSRDGPGTNLYEGNLLDAWWYSEDFDEFMLYHECGVLPGISGGGTFDIHGHYIGMLSAGNGTGALSLPLVTILQEYLGLAGEMSRYGL